MDTIPGPEWIILLCVVMTFLVCVYLVITVQGDLALDDRFLVNTDDRAIATFIDMVNQTRREIIIHDDGTDLPRSIYNDPGVINALRGAIQKRNISVRCLFNDRDQPLKLVDLARSDEFRNNIEIWYLRGERPVPDTHYKIVDGGKLLHISEHEHGGDERKYKLLKAPRLIDFATRNRISKPFHDNFALGLQNADRAA